VQPKHVLKRGHTRAELYRRLAVNPVAHKLQRVAKLLRIDPQEVVRLRRRLLTDRLARFPHSPIPGFDQVRSNAQDGSPAGSECSGRTESQRVRELFAKHLVAARIEYREHPFPRQTPPDLEELLD